LIFTISGKKTRPGTDIEDTRNEVITLFNMEARFWEIWWEVEGHRI
jgi:hypothetical protein